MNVVQVCVEETLLMACPASPAHHGLHLQVWQVDSCQLAASTSMASGSAPGTTRTCRGVNAGELASLGAALNHQRTGVSGQMPRLLYEHWRKRSKMEEKEKF